MALRFIYTFEVNIKLVQIFLKALSHDMFLFMVQDLVES